MGSRFPEMTGNPPPAAALKTTKDKYMNMRSRQLRKPNDILKYLDCIIDGRESLPIEIDIEELVSMRCALHEAIKKKKEAQSKWIKSVKEVYEICSAVERRILGYQYKLRERQKNKIK